MYEYVWNPPSHFGKGASGCINLLFYLENSPKTVEGWVNFKTPLGAANIISLWDINFKIVRLSISSLTHHTPYNSLKVEATYHNYY